MIKIIAILEGWKNYIFPSEAVERKAKARAEICAKCPYSQKGNITQHMPDGSISKGQGMVCTKCGCPLSTLLRQDKVKCENLPF